MTITINGEKREFGALETLSEVLEQLGMDGRPVVIEHNQTALLPREVPLTPVRDGDIVEIIQITAGG